MERPGLKEQPRLLHDERRRFARHGVAGVLSVAWLQCNDKTVPAKVDDESDGGVGLIIRQRPTARVGDAVVLDRLLEQVESFTGAVRYVRESNVDEWRIGLEWT